tara:strand:+ start:92 stop:385 length:294 start_codon:yes stop_codon:yes gene_type:complete
MANKKQTPARSKAISDLRKNLGDYLRDNKAQHRAARSRAGDLASAVTAALGMPIPALAKVSLQKFRQDESKRKMKKLDEMIEKEKDRPDKKYTAGSS